MIPNYNARIIFLIPKTSDMNSMDSFKPISLANFNFKLIFKIIVEKLAKIMPYLVNREQKCSMPRRNIKDCLCLASELANLLD